MEHVDNVLPKSNMMQLEEVNRATSPEEYRQKYDQWMRDRGFPVEDQIFSFVQVMQYCEKLEEQHRRDVGQRSGRANSTGRLPRWVGGGQEKLR